jgi:hypothetical protein
MKTQAVAADAATAFFMAAIHGASLRAIDMRR